MIGVAMKKALFFIAALPILAGMTGAGCAHDKNVVESESYPNSTNGTYLTGSNLPQDINRNGPVTNGKNNVRIIDRSDINRSGGADVGQTLRQLGVTP
jgi:hypothetical protein